MRILLRKLILLLLLCPSALMAQQQDSLLLESDTLTINQRRQMRGLTSKEHVFVPKGQWIFGGSASYSTHGNHSYDLFIIEDMETEGYTFKITPMLAYAVHRNLAVGARFVYSRSLQKLDHAGVSIGDEESGVSVAVEDYYVLRHSYEGALFCRSYIPLGHNKRFALFADVQLSGGGIQGKYAEGNPVRGTYEEGYSLGLGVTPGLIAFATNNMAVELTVGVLGVSYTHLEQVHNQVTYGERESSNMSFKINLLSIGLGISFHL